MIAAPSPMTALAAAAALPLSQRLGLTVLALGMVFGGQLMMRAETDVSALALTLALAGAACVAWATSDLPLWQRERIGPAMVPIWSPARIGLLVLAVAGMLGVLGVLRGTSGISVGPWVLAAWGAIIGAYAAATTPWCRGHSSGAPAHARPQRQPAGRRATGSP